MPSFKIIDFLVLEKQIFLKVFAIYSNACDLTHLYKLSFPLPKNTPREVWLRLAQRFQRRRRLKSVVNNYNYNDGRRRMGIREPYGSGELKSISVITCLIRLTIVLMPF